MSIKFKVPILILLFVIIGLVIFVLSGKNNKEVKILKEDCYQIILQAQEWYQGLDTKLAREIGYSRFTFREIGKPPETLSNQDLTWTNQNGSFTISERTPEKFTLTATGMEEKQVQFIVVKDEPVAEPKIIRQ